MSIQKLILGNQIIQSEAQKRKVLLGGYLILIYIGIGLFFFIVNLFNPDGDPTSLFIGFIISIVCLFLLRTGRSELALVIHFLRANFIAFYFSLIDESAYLTGTYIYFVPASLGALAVFGYTERWKGIGFTALSILLFSIAILEPGHFKPNNAHFYFIANFMIIFLIGVLILLFFDRMVVTAEKEIIQKNKELIKTNAELDRFVYSASHDMRAPLSSILGLINISKKSSDPAEVNQYMEMIRGRVHHLDNFIREIIDYSRNARLDIENNRIDIAKLIDDVFEGLKFTEGVVQIKFEKSVPAGLDFTSDIVRLRVILNNLISNAIRYHDEKKAEKFIRIEIVDDLATTLVKVIDNGQGIGAQHQPKIFDMFYQASDNSDGSGLGLYIVKETVTRLGGTVEVESEIGTGSTFTVKLLKGRSSLH